LAFVLAASYNQPNLSVCASWNENATTFANINWVGKQPAGVFVNDENTIYVANREHGRILVWHNRSSTPKMNISGNLTSPWSLFATADGDIYVDNGDSNNRVDRWTLNATVSKLAMKVNGMCTGLFVDINDNLYCSSANDHRVVKIALKSGKTLPSTVAGIGCPGPVPNMLDHPHGIFVDNNLNLYVADTQNNRIQFFAPDQMNAITVAGFGAIVYFILNKPTGVVLDADGYLFIVDSYNHRIVRSMPDDFKCVVGCSGNRGSSSSQLNTPQTMAFDTNGNIFVSDFNNHRIQKFSLTLNPYGMSISIAIEMFILMRKKCTS
jgi:streptogramin lyase